MKWDESKHPRDELGRFTDSGNNKYFRVTPRKPLARISLMFFSEKGLREKRPIELKRGIRSIRRRLLEHLNKIQNPELYCKNWQDFSPERQRGTLEFWQKEIDDKQRAILERIEILKEKGENVDEFDT